MVVVGVGLVVGGGVEVVVTGVLVGVWVVVAGVLVSVWVESRFRKKTVVAAAATTSNAIATRGVTVTSWADRPDGSGTGRCSANRSAGSCQCF